MNLSFFELQLLFLKMRSAADVVSAVTLEFRVYYCTPREPTLVIIQREQAFALSVKNAITINPWLLEAHCRPSYGKSGQKCGQRHRNIAVRRAQSFYLQHDGGHPHQSSKPTHVWQRCLVSSTKIKRKEEKNKKKSTCKVNK